MGRLNFAKAAVTGIVFAGLCASSAAYAAPIIGLITKTEGNPYFVKMREGAQAEAQKLGVTLKTYAGKFDGDNDSQVAAIEDLIAQGAKGFAIVPSDSSAIVPTIQKARAAGLLVIDLDTPTDPITAVDATYATDNRKAGMLIGEWAKARSATRRRRPRSPSSTSRPTSRPSIICATRALWPALAST